VDGAEKKSVVLEANAEALRRGVRPAMPVAQALARCPGLTVILRTPEHEHLAGAALLHVAASLSPEIEATAPGICTLHLRLPDNHDWHAMGMRALSLLETQQLRATAGIAPNPDLAFLAAHRALPVLVVLAHGRIAPPGLKQNCEPDFSGGSRHRLISDEPLALIANTPPAAIVNTPGPEARHRLAGAPPVSNTPPAAIVNTPGPEARHRLAAARKPPVSPPQEITSPGRGVTPSPAGQKQPLPVREAAAFLDSLPVAALDPPPDVLTLLSDWGIRTLGDLRTLPRGELMDRLGPEAGRLWDHASGSASRPLRLITPPAEFTESFDFEYEVETTEPLLFILRRLLDQLTQRMRGIWRVAGSMKLILRLEDGSPYERLFTIPEPTANPHVLFRVLNTHLESLTLTQRPVGLGLHLEPAAISRDQLQLFEASLRDPNGLGETLARLAALPGAENVGVLCRQDTHQPDQWTVTVPRFHQLPAQAHPDTSASATGLPLHRLRPPQKAIVRLQEHRPVTVESPEACGPVTDALGPYRLSGRWWDRLAAWAQEEWDVELENGSLLRLARRAEEWVVSGYYELEP
jgi:nucleotidyltransferase/DNA polymerase involved in DNA repair